MDKTSLIDFPLDLEGLGAFILKGSLKTFSTEALHYHSCHQLLRISSGITLLVDEEKKQPLFSNMTALIPAGVAHRSLVMGEAVHYKSIYLDRPLLKREENRVVIFDMSDLGVALFDRIEGDQTDEGLNQQCLNLLLKLVEKELSCLSSLTRIPLPHNRENKKIISFMEDNFYKRLSLSDFTTVLNFSERHISRIFKEDLGISIFEYLKLYRIFRASLMLCETGYNQSITEMAFSCGYDSLSSFYKDFKAIFSFTPKQFRERGKLI
jgi:AraC-like DNA-binding protein